MEGCVTERDLLTFLPQKIWQQPAAPSATPRRFLFCANINILHKYKYLAQIQIQIHFCFKGSAASAVSHRFIFCFWQDLNQSVTFVKILIRMNVRIYSYQQNYTNEYPNIFILIFFTRTNVPISIRNENCTNIRIYSNIRLGFTL